MLILDNKTIEEIEAEGFTVHRDEDDGTYRFGRCSSRGQDFSFEVQPGDDLFDLTENVYRYYESYDVSEETALWIDSSGHGKRGAPYDIEDIVADMKECEQSILDLYDILQKIRYSLESEDEYADMVNEEQEEENMSVGEFYEYILKNFSLSGEAKRLVKNILDYASRNFFEDDLYDFLNDTLNTTIGLSDAEIRRVYN